MNDLARLLHEATGEGDCFWVETGQSAEWIDAGDLMCKCGKTAIWHEDRWDTYVSDRIMAEKKGDAARFQNFKTSN